MGFGCFVPLWNKLLLRPWPSPMDPVISWACTVGNWLLNLQDGLFLSMLKGFDIDFYSIRSSAVKFLSIDFPTHILIKREGASKFYSCNFKCGLLKTFKIGTFKHLSCLLCHLVFLFFFFNQLLASCIEDKGL